MIFENAFSFLPEILVGSCFLRNDYEASIVNAFSLAVLQSLNARNFPNPLSAITVERAYSKEGFPASDSTASPRYPRADLFVNISEIKTASRGLSFFGWRHQNWLEAKYFRKNNEGKPKIASTDAILFISEDLFRLCALVDPFITTGLISSGRYFLHVYEGNPEVFLGAGKRNQKKGYRNWLKSIRSPGIQDIFIDISSFIRDSKKFEKAFPSPLNHLKMNAKIQNYIFEQYGGDESKRITCVLTRFVSFKIEMNGYTLEENERRERSCTPNFAGEEIRKAIGIYMGAKAKEADIPVSADEQSRIDADASDSSSN